MNVWTEMYDYCDPFRYESAIMSLSGRCASALLIVFRFIYVMATTWRWNCAGIFHVESELCLSFLTSLVPTWYTPPWSKPPETWSHHIHVSVEMAHHTHTPPATHSFTATFTQNLQRRWQLRRVSQLRPSLQYLQLANVHNSATKKRRKLSKHIYKS